MAWIWPIIATIAAILLAFLCLVCWFMGRRAKVDVQLREQEVVPRKLANPAILPSGGKHPAGTPLVCVPPPDGSVYYRIGQPTTIHMASFERLDGQVIVLGAPHPSNIPNSYTDIPHVTGSIVVQAFSYAPGREDSDIVTAMLEITPPTGEVFYSHPPGVYDHGLVLTLWHPETANIFYTSNGDDPWEAGIPYTGPLLLTETTEIRAAAQGSRTPATVKKYIVPKMLDQPLLLVSGRVCGDTYPHVDIHPSDYISFSHKLNDNWPNEAGCPTVLYSVERAEHGYNAPNMPTSVFSAPVTFTPGVWVLKAVSVKPEWKDSEPLCVFVRCAPNEPTITETGTIPRVVTIAADNSIIGYSVTSAEGTKEGRELSPVQITLQEPGAYLVEADATDPDTFLTSKPLRLSVQVEAKVLPPVYLDPPGGRYVVKDTFPIMINSSGGDARSAKLTVNGEMRVCKLGEETQLRGFGRKAVTAAAVDGSSESAPVSQVYRLVPDVPRVAPRGGICGVGTLCRIERPALPPWGAQVVLHYSCTYHPKLGGQPDVKTDSIKGDTSLNLERVGRYDLKAYCAAAAEGEEVQSDTVEVCYEVTEEAKVQIPEAAPQADVKYTHAPTFYPVEGRHVGDELDVYLSCLDDGDIDYGINKSEPDTSYTLNSAIVIRHEDLTDGVVTISACAKVVGKYKSRVVQKTYRLDPRPQTPRMPTPIPTVTPSPAPTPRAVVQPRKPTLTCHAVQLLVELQLPDSDNLIALYTLDHTSPMTQPGGSTLQLPRNHSIPIPRKGTTELKAITVDTTGACTPSRVVSKTFVEGAPYLPVSKNVHHEVVGNGLAPPVMIAHARVIVVVATADDPSWVIRYTMDGSEPTAASSLFPSTGLQIALQMGRKPGVLRVVTFDATNQVKSQEVVQDFVSINGTEPPPDPVQLSPPPSRSPSPNNPPHATGPAGGPPGPNAPASQPPYQPCHQQTQSTPSLHPLVFYAAEPRPVAQPAITSSSAVPDSFSRGLQAAKLRAERRAVALAELKRQEREMQANR